MALSLSCLWIRLSSRAVFTYGHKKRDNLSTLPFFKYTIIYKTTIF
jgi:hypothetical protein